MTPALFPDLGVVLAGLAAATVAGGLLIRPFTATLTRRERLAWGLATGLLLQAGCLLLLLGVGARPDAWKMLALEAFIAVIAALAARSRGVAAARVSATRAAHMGDRRALVVLLSCVAGAAWLVFFVGSLADSMWATDFLAFWGYKGRIVFLTGEIPQRLFHDPALYFAHPEYPLLVPLTLAALASFVGRWNDQALALLYPICALATLAAISGFLARRVSRVAGAAAAALSSLCFFLYRPANAGTAEIPLALGLVLATSAAIDFLQQDDASGAAKLAIASLFCASVKQEGALFVLLLAAVLWWRPRRAGKRPAGWLAAAALALPVAAHAILMRLLRGSEHPRDFDFSLLEPSRWPELASRYGLVVRHIVGGEARQALVPILAIVLFFLATRRGIGDPLIPTFAGQFVVYTMAFTVSAFGPSFAIDTALGRLTMSLFPAFTLVLGARLPTAFMASAAGSRTPHRPASGTAGN